MRNTIVLFLFAVFTLFIGCKKTIVDPVPINVDYSQDYFPFTKTYLWSYTSNALSDSGKSYVNFQTKIDTFSFRRGTFWALLGKIDTMAQWGAFLSLKDSNGVVYTLGDNPPEILYPLFKHSYASNEGIQESITVGAVTYETVRIDFITSPGDTVHLWFSKGIGLVKEMSNQGQSLFSDDNASKKVHIETRLTQITK